MSSTKHAAALAGRLRRAIVTLIQPADPSADPGGLRRAATRLVLRTIVARLGHARALIPDAPSTWPGLVAQARELHARGAGLFAPGDAGSEDPSARLLARLEAHPYPDATIAALLEDLALPELGELETQLIGLAYQRLLDDEPRLDAASGSWQLARRADLRKTAGSFYTPPALARATAARTLAPLLGPGVDRRQLRICDPAMGAGSFLFAALDVLSEADPARPGPTRRELAERCLYGVDLDPLAVELTRMSLWLELRDPTLALDRFDAHLRRGDALLGCWRERVGHYPVLAWEREGGDARHRNFVHHRHGGGDGDGEARGDRWTRAIEVRRAAISSELAEVLRASVPAPIEPTRAALDTWCALWFWPPDALDSAPTPRNFADPPTQARAQITRLSRALGFFHWQLEFPEIFDRPRPGFDAILTNPPWDTLQPVSREFFARRDPAYAGYTKPEALRAQARLFHADPELERAWIEYQHHFVARSNFVAFASSPWASERGGAPYPRLARGAANLELHARWRAQRGDADAPARPFRVQGRGKVQTYKLFVELGHALCREGGSLGAIVPSGIYSDRGTRALRELLLERCDWRWLFGFDNRAGIFGDLERRFKFAVVIATKGAATTSLRAAFMRRSVRDWSAAEPRALTIPRPSIHELSPRSAKLLELDDARDLEILRKLHRAGVRLDERARYRQGDLNMTSDARLFVTPAQAQARGFAPSEQGLWLRGGWIDARTIDLDAVDEVLCPLLEGAGIARYEGHARAPRYLVPWAAVRDRLEQPAMIEFAFRDIARATDSRSLIGAPVYAEPCGNTLGKLRAPSQAAALDLAIALDSLVLDWAARLRLGGTHLNLYVIEELSVPRSSLARGHLLARGLAFVGARSARAWTSSPRARAWPRLWALTAHERLRRVVILDALVAHAFGLTREELGWILRGCDHPDPRALADASPLGFWRVDKRAPPHLRHPVLVQVAHAELERLGLDAFVGDAEGGEDEGWMLPETLRLADYGLGHDADANRPQVLAAALGPRVLDSQLQADPAASWAACERHAAILDALLA